MATWVTDLYPGGSKETVAGDSFAFKQAPCKFVLHTTETSDFPQYPANKAPHVTAHYGKKLWHQHQSLDKPAWALKAPANVSTNSMGAIQIEIVGYAASLKDISAPKLNWLAGLIRMLMNQTNIPIQSSVTFGGSETYGVNGPKRLSVAAWNSYKGILGHQHVPGNEHWDPGAIDINQWLTAISGSPVESDMPNLVGIVFDQGANSAAGYASTAIYNETIGWVQTSEGYASRGTFDAYNAIANALGFNVTQKHVDANGWELSKLFKFPGTVPPWPAITVPPATVDNAAIAASVVAAINATGVELSEEEVAKISIATVALMPKTLS